jgi:hypothetical protein
MWQVTSRWGASFQDQILWPCYATMSSLSLPGFFFLNYGSQTLPFVPAFARSLVPDPLRGSCCCSTFDCFHRIAVFVYMSSRKWTACRQQLPPSQRRLSPERCSRPTTGIWRWLTHFWSVLSYGAWLSQGWSSASFKVSRDRWNLLISWCQTSARKFVAGQGIPHKLITSTHKLSITVASRLAVIWYAGSYGF